MKKIIIMLTMLVGLVAGAFAFEPVKVYEDNRYSAYYIYDEDYRCYTCTSFNSLDDVIDIMDTCVNDDGYYWYGSEVSTARGDNAKEYAEWMNENNHNSLIFAHRYYYNDGSYDIDEVCIFTMSENCLIRTLWEASIK